MLTKQRHSKNHDFSVTERENVSSTFGLSQAFNPQSTCTVRIHKVKKGKKIFAKCFLVRFMLAQILAGIIRQSTSKNKKNNKI